MTVLREFAPVICTESTWYKVEVSLCAIVNEIKHLAGLWILPAPLNAIAIEYFVSADHRDAFV